MYKYFKSLIVVAGMALAANANAELIFDYVDVSEDYGDYLLLSEGDSYSITHDLTDQGVPGNRLVDRAWLAVGLSDDIYGCWSGDPTSQAEIALITGEGVNSGEVEVDGSVFRLDYQFLSVGDAGVSALNSFGLLEITVTALLGDFYWMNSILVADTSVSVSEPGSLAILAVGLLGLGAIRFRKIA